MDIFATESRQRDAGVSDDIKKKDSSDKSFRCNTEKKETAPFLG